MKYVLSILNNLNFSAAYFDLEKFTQELELLRKDIDSLMISGWREKLVATYMIAYFNLKEYESYIFEQFDEGKLSRDFKGFLIALLALVEDRDFLYKTLDDYLERYKDSHELRWLYASLNIIDEKSSKEYEKEEFKIKKALEIIKNNTNLLDSD